MTKRVSSLVLAIVMLLQILVPQTTIAKEEVKAPSDDLVTVGVINGNSYDAKLMLELNRLTARSRVKKSADPGTTLFSYFDDGQEPKDEDKLKYHGEVKANLTVKGLDGNPFQWKEVFGTEELHLRFIQMDDETGVETGTERVLNVSKAGKYTWTDGEGKPAELPLFDNNLKPLTYEVKLDEEVSDKVKLLTARLATTGDAGSPTFEKPDADGRIKYHLTLDIGLQQVASSKFVSEWHTAVEESARPQLEGTMTGSGGSKPKTAIFDLPKNDTDSVILRANSTKESRKKDKIFVNFLYNTPTNVEVITSTSGLDFNTTKKTVKSGEHKYKYDFKYDVINGGKLTMTEILPVTFDANGGKFKNFTDPDTETKIVKEVEYDGILTDKAEEPKKALETFKGWAKSSDGPVLSEEDFKAEIKNIKKAKTFFAIWDNNEIQANELTVHESFKDGTGYVNDFIPDLAKLKEQVKIKDADGNPKALADDDKLQILDDSGNPIADADLKDKLYEKLKEDDATEVSRNVEFKAKVTFANNKTKEVTIPIKVIKNIYEAKTLTKKPYYVPDNYVMVTLDPTTKAQDPQKTYYYVNPAAKVVIPGKDPVGTGDNTFVKWIIKGSTEEYKLTEKPRHKFSGETTIEAQYESDVIPQTGTEKPKTVPSNFVEVKFVPTDKATDETKAEKIYWVNPDKEVTIPVKDPVGKTYYTFKEWKLGADAKGDKYTPSTPKKFTEAITITATYEEAKNIIPYDPKEPTTRPEGYVRVTFAADPGLKLTEQKAYYVKKNAGITLGNAELVKPGVNSEIGWKQKSGADAWDQKDSLVIEAADIVVTAKATKLDNVIPETKDDGTPNDKPAGYKEVTFVIKTEDAAKGSLEGTTKYYVNPNEYVTITPPTTKPETGYEFGAWDKDTKTPNQYKDDTKITGSFNDLENVIPKIKPNGSENTKPEGYYTVTFEIEKVDGKDPAKFVKGEKLVYFVKPNASVTINPPQYITEIGYKFDKWDSDTTQNTTYTKDTTVRGKFTKIPDIVPATDASGNTVPKPDGYVKVVFISESEGKLKEGQKVIDQKVYYVNPEAKKQLGELTKPDVIPETGYEKDQWAILGATNYNDKLVIEDDLIIKAKYKPLADVVPKENPQGGENTKPAEYITVTFKTTDKGGNVEKVIYINPNKAVELDVQAPNVNPITGYEFASWDRPIKEKIQYKDGDVITAQFNEIGNVSKVEKPSYVKVEFKEGDHGKLTGDINLWIKPDTSVTIPAPTVNPNVGYKFDKWDKSLTVNLATGSPTYEITAGYTTFDNIIPQKNTDGSDKPDGYVTVTFDKGEHGTLSGQTVYYVNPNKEVTLPSPTVTPETGWKQKAGDDAWNSKLTQIFTKDTKITAQYEELKDVIPKTVNDESEKPKGYVTVRLVPTDKATDNKEKVYFVNPNKEVTIPDNTPTGKEVTDTNENKYTYIFKGWTVTRGVIASWDKVNEDENPVIKSTFKQDTDITAKYNIKAENLVNGPIAKENVVTQINEKPEAKDLIKNIYDSNDPSNKGNLPDGTKFEYEKEPDVSKAGDTTAKVKVTYPNNKTVVVEVPIKVVDNVIPQEGTEKPKNVPQDFVKVTFVPTDKGTMDGAKIFWVKPNTDVTIPVNNPKGVGYNIFKEWKIGENADGETYNPTVAKQFPQATTITATYTDSENIIPVDPTKPTVIPEGYVIVSFDADLGLKLTGIKYYYVKANAGITIGNLTKPEYKVAKGYAFNGWDKADNIVINKDMVVTAKAKESSSPTPSPDPTPSPTPDSGSSYPRVVHRDKIVEKEKIVEKIVRVGESQLLKEVRYMQGFNGYFRPNDGLTRAEAAQILANALVEDGYKYNPNFKISYKDVGEAWYTRAVKIVTEANVFAGYDDGNFKPQAKITRNEWIATLKRFQELGDASGNNMNLSDNHWAKAEIQAAFNEGWLKIYTDGLATYNGDEFIPRQEVAAVSNKAFKRIVDKAYIGKNNLGLITYKDVNTSMWAYEDILCASNTFLDRKDRYIAHWVKEDKNQFNIDTSDLKIVQKNFQRNPR